ncbi:DUF6193 family natural product biosynthesis protein [Streptomyces virginiae]|uniref:DUF6193 family natural product biosynthesis protein n=1 Tax=Streptomyces virginiae TaxID=1961 RepID=UPI0036C92EE6
MSSTTSDVDVLTAAGWFPGRDAAGPAMRAILEARAVVDPRVGGTGREVFPAAREALRAYHGLLVRPSGPGLDVAPTGAVVDPREAAYSVGCFHHLGAELGVLLFPFGRTDADAPLAVDELGRLFSVDHGGARLLGESVAEGLTSLARGRMPVRVTARREAWTRGPLPAEDLLLEAVRAALTAVYVLHRHGAYSARAVRLRATTLRGLGALALDRVFPLPGGSLEAAAVPLVRDMARALAAEGVRTEGTELQLSVPPPPAVTGPPATFAWALTVGASAAHPSTADLTLTAGAGASVGEAAATFDACVADLVRPTAAEIVATAWRTVLDHGPDRVDPAVPRAAYVHPTLRELFPAVSHGVLYLSRCTEFPWTLDIGTAFPQAGGGYRVRRQSDDTLLGVTDTVEEAYRLIAAHLPEGCGPAIGGTANDL